MANPTIIQGIPSRIESWRGDDNSFAVIKIQIDDTTVEMRLPADKVSALHASIGHLLQSMGLGRTLN